MLSLCCGTLYKAAVFALGIYFFIEFLESKIIKDLVAFYWMNIRLGCVSP